MDARTLLTALAALTLTACGGDDFEDVGSSHSMFIDYSSTTAITYELPAAGTYELRVTGSLSCKSKGAVITLAILTWPASVDGGDPESSYELSDCKRVSIDQRVTYTVEGAGPWQVVVQVFHDQGVIYSNGDIVHNVAVGGLQLSKRSL